MMPELDGFGVLERLKQSGRINDLPVVVISALNEIEPVVRCVELGAEDFIFKPFNPTLLRARVMASLEKKALRDRTRDELRRKQMELDEARTLQLALVPAPLRDSIGGRTAAVDAVLEPAKEVGGDLVDHFRIGEDLLVVSVGDVSDKGAGAALMMARTHALVRGLSVRPDAAALFREPEKAVALLNAALAKGNDSGMYVTLLLGTLDFAGNRLAYVRAGHVPPYLRRADGSLERLEHLGGLSARLDGEGGLQVRHHGLRGRRRDPGADRWLHGGSRSRWATVRRGSDRNLHAAGRSRRSRVIVHAGPAGPRLRRRHAAVGRHGGHFALAARRRDGMNRSGYQVPRISNWRIVAPTRASEMTTASDLTAATARRPWYQSIAGNLLLAFALIAALTVSATLLSLIRFNQIDAVMNRLTGVSLPLVQSSLGVEAKTAELVVLATELSKAENEAQRFERMERLSDQIGQLWSVLSKLQTIISEETTAARLQQLVAAINTNIGDLDRSTREFFCSAIVATRPSTK